MVYTFKKINTAEIIEQIKEKAYKDLDDCGYKQLAKAIKYINKFKNTKNYNKVIKYYIGCEMLCQLEKLIKNGRKIIFVRGKCIELLRQYDNSWAFEIFDKIKPNFFKKFKKELNSQSRNNYCIEIINYNKEDYYIEVDQTCLFREEQAIQNSIKSDLNKIIENKRLKEIYYKRSS